MPARRSHLRSIVSMLWPLLLAQAAAAASTRIEGLKLEPQPEPAPRPDPARSPVDSLAAMFLAGLVLLAGAWRQTRRGGVGSRPPDAA